MQYLYCVASNALQNITVEIEESPGDISCSRDNARVAIQVQVLAIAVAISYTAVVRVTSQRVSIQNISLHNDHLASITNMVISHDKSREVVREWTRKFRTHKKHAFNEETSHLKFESRFDSSRATTCECDSSLNIMRVGFCFFSSPLAVRYAFVHMEAAVAV